MRIAEAERQLSEALHTIRPGTTWEKGSKITQGARLVMGRHVTITVPAEVGQSARLKRIDKGAMVFAFKEFFADPVKVHKHRTAVHGYSMQPMTVFQIEY